MSLAERKWLRLATLVILYVAQGIPWGFMATTIPAYLASRGLDTNAVGIALATTTLPYSFKWVWGPIIDTFTIARFGRRRPWIVFAQLMMALTVGTMLLIPDFSTDLKLVAWMILIHTVFNALQDVAVDALAVDLLDDDERGRANGLMYGAKYGGGAIGGIGLATVIAYTSLETALAVQAILLLLIMLVPLLVRETNKPPEKRPRFGDVLTALADVFASRSAAVMTLVMLTFTFALGVLTARATTLFTQELGWKPEKYTSLVGGYGLAAGLIGASVGGFISDFVGRKRLAAMASVGMGLGWLVFSLNQGRWTDDAFVYPMAMWETLCQSVMSVSLFALCMEVSFPAAGASQFTAYMALSNFATTLGYRFAGKLPESWTISDVYLAAAVFQIAVTSLLLFIDPGQTRRELPRPAGAGIPPRGVYVLCALTLFLASMTQYIVSGIV